MPRPRIPMAHGPVRQCVLVGGDWSSASPRPALDVAPLTCDHPHAGADRSPRSSWMQYGTLTITPRDPRRNKAGPGSDRPRSGVAGLPYQSNQQTRSDYPRMSYRCASKTTLPETGSVTPRPPPRSSSTPDRRRLADGLCEDSSNRTPLLVLGGTKLAVEHTGRQRLTEGCNAFAKRSGERVWPTAWRAGPQSRGGASGFRRSKRLAGLPDAWRMGRSAPRQSAWNVETRRQELRGAGDTYSYRFALCRGGGGRLVS